MNEASNSLISPPSRRPPSGESGIVLPVALALLLVVLVAGVSAARVSLAHHAFADNLRTTQVARQAAEIGLAYCQQVVVDLMDNDSERFGTDVTGRVLSPAAPETAVTNGHWNTLTHWSAAGEHLITVPQGYSSTVKPEAELRHSPVCMAELISEDRFVITARGLSNDAELDDQARVTHGSEMWLQSVLKPIASIASSRGGIQ